MVKHLEIDAADTAAPYGYRKDGTPRNPPGRKANPGPQTVPDVAHAAPPVRRNNPRPAPKQMNRETVREPVRANTSVVGRNGEELRRMRPEAGGDIFERVKAPPGWSYQWCSITALNKELSEIHQSMAIDFYENGWRPVPASRHPGVWTPPGFEGAIVVKGMRLEERPLALTQEARREDEIRAKAQLRDQTDALKLTQAQLPGGDAKNAKAATGMRMSIDKSFEVPPDNDYDLDTGA